MNQRGILIVVSGFSGAGKGTLMKELMKRYEETYALSVSATTRNPREGEVDGRNIFSKQPKNLKNDCERRADRVCRYVENYYGTPRTYVEQQLEAGKDVILEIEIQGALKVKERFPDTLLLFVTPPSAKELRRRLVGRGTETMEVIESRLARAVEESEYMDQYDYLVINDDLDVCVSEMHKIIQGEHQRSFRNESFIQSMKQDLKGNVKGDR